MDDIQKIEHYVLSIISMLIVAIMSIGLVIQSSFYFGISWFGIMMTLCSCCIILDANTTLRSLCCSLFSIGAIIPIFVANCWWGAAVIPVAIATESLSVSIYLGEYTSLRAGTLVTGPLSLGYYSYGNHAKAGSIPIDLMRRTNWFYFLNTIDVLTSEDKHALICYGDSITAQAWPDNLSILLEKNKIYDVSVIRRAICGTRILREYNCITYASYGPKGERRFDNETDVAGADAVIIQHGINDIIHPVGTQVNVFRPWEDLPTVDELKQAVKSLYVEVARAKGLSIISGTLLPIYGWRTYEPMREQMRTEFNTWLRSSNIFDKCIDFDRALARKSDVRQFVEEYDSGDHLHPSSDGYKRMAKEALNVLKEGINGKPYFKQD